MVLEKKFHHSAGNPMERLLSNSKTETVHMYERNMQLSIRSLRVRIKVIDWKV